MAVRNGYTMNINRHAQRSFVTGSAAPAFEPEKIREAKKEYIERTQRIVEERAVSKRLSARSFTKKQIAVFVLCTFAVLAITSYYLVTAANVRRMQQKVESLRMEYNLLLKENELTRDQIEAAVDYAEVYRVAVEELHMQTPEKNQMIVYDRPGTEYVIKFADTAD